MAQWIANGPCPKCGSKDNRAEYEDGSHWCFGCETYTPPTIQGRLERIRKPVEELENCVSLPDDYDPFYLPKEAIEWLAQYELTTLDAKQNRAGWSEYYCRMIFPIIVQGELLAWQGRYFPELDDRPLLNGKKRPKWLTKGNIHEITYLLQSSKKSTSIVLVEDLVSAIKIQKMGLSSSPLFGSQITSQQKKGLLYSGYTDVILWLDRDKAQSSSLYAKQLQDIGFKVRVVVTELDPKEISFDDLRKIV